MIILNVTKRKNTGPHVTHDPLTHLMATTHVFGVFKKICKVFLLDLMNNISVNNVYVKTYSFTHVVCQNYVYFRIQ